MKNHFWSTLVLSVLLGIVGAMFTVPGYDEVIPHPQFDQFDQTEQVIAMIRATDKNTLSTNGLLWFKCFFIIDFIWAACLLTFLYRWIRLKSKGEDAAGRKSQLILILLLIFSVPAYALDVLENINYLLLLSSSKAGWLSTLVDLKVIFYSLVFIMVIVFLYQQYVFENLSVLKRSIKASSISLLSITVLVVLATFMDQGSTVIIHLFEHPLSMAMAFVLLTLLSLASAHYPDYLDKYFTPGANTGILWEMHPLAGKKPCLGIGLILYQDNPPDSTGNKEAIAAQRQAADKDKRFLDHFRKITGLLVILTWIYVLLFVNSKYEILSFPLLPITGAVIAAFIYLYFTASAARESWRTHLAEKSNFQHTIENSTISLDWHSLPSNVRFYLKATIWVFILLVLCLTVTVLFSKGSAWVNTWVAVLITTFINAVFIILFQHFRTVFSMAPVPGWLRRIPIYYLHNDKQYVRFFAIMGFISMALFVSITFEPGLINALVIILLFIYLLYGLVVILFKHHLFYSFVQKISSPAVVNETATIFFEKYVPVMGIVLLIWIFFTGKTGNGLHTIPLVSESTNGQVSMEAFKAQIRSNRSGPEGGDTYLISSYGGGLRATAWTMLLLDTLDNINPDIYKRTLAMSGVSGGFLGLSMYSAIRNEHSDDRVRLDKIDTIGKHNMLSIDISYLLGFDFIREMIPYRGSFCFRDRAGRSMEEYASLIQPDPHRAKALLTDSYRQYWSKACSTSQGTFLPAIIGNTTGTHSRYGVAFSVGTSTTGFDSIFPGSTNILDIDSQHSISYLDATSTTERFPVFSPTAQIKGKGHFLDGGYFENSGLLSLTNFYEFLKQDSTLSLHDSTTKIVVIINSKSAYIRHVLGDDFIPKYELATGEWSAILKTVADTDILPLALESMLKNRFGDRLIRIYLPYPITYADVIQLIRGNPKNPFTIQEKINASNKKIADLLHPYTKEGSHPVPPALARVLSDPAYTYLKAMRHHEDVISELKRIR